MFPTTKNVDRSRLMLLETEANQQVQTVRPRTAGSDMYHPGYRTDSSSGSNNPHLGLTLPRLQSNATGRAQQYADPLQAQRAAERANEVAFRAYQLRPRPFLSATQHDAIMAATWSQAGWVLTPANAAAQTFTMRLHTSTSLSFHVFEKFTENAKTKEKGKAIHAALKRHGIIAHKTNILGKVGLNHRRPLALPINAMGGLDQQDLDKRMAGVMQDLSMSGQWNPQQLNGLSYDIPRIINQFAALVFDVKRLGGEWRGANYEVKKLKSSKVLGIGKREELMKANANRNALKQLITCGKPENDELFETAENTYAQSTVSDDDDSEEFYRPTASQRADSLIERKSVVSVDEDVDDFFKQAPVRRSDFRVHDTPAPSAARPAIAAPPVLAARPWYEDPAPAQVFSYPAAQNQQPTYEAPATDDWWNTPIAPQKAKEWWE